MKHLKTFENEENLDNIDKLENELLDILDDEIETEDYYGDTTISGSSKRKAAKKIVEYLTKLGIDFDQYFDAKKYNV
jgi:hypothetical protein